MRHQDQTQLLRQTIQTQNPRNQNIHQAVNKDAGHCKFTTVQEILSMSTCREVYKLII